MKDKKRQTLGLMWFSYRRGKEERNKRMTHRLAEEKVEEQLQFLQTLLDTIPSPVFYKNAEGKYMGCNNAFGDYIGMPAEEIIGKTVYDIGPKEIADKYYEKDEELFKNPGKQSYEWKIRGKRGEIRDVIIDKATFGDGKGKIEGLIGVISDITERKRAEEALRESEEFSSSLMNNAPNPILILNPDASIRYVNPALEKLTGFSSSELVGRKPPQPWWTERAFQEFDKKLEEIMHNGARGLEQLFQTKDGKQFWVEITSTPVIINGEFKHYHSSWVEITDRKHAEEQIKASLREKEVLLNEIHHRVKNNLQIVSSLLNLQSDYIQDKQALEVLTESQNRIRSMALVHELLYRSKNLVSIDFDEYIRDLRSYLCRSYPQGLGAFTINTNVENGVSLDIDKAIPLGLVINELVSNSLKHAFPESKKRTPSPEGEAGEIHIDLRSGNDGNLILMVSDNGIGFPIDLDFRNTQTLGLQLVSALTNQLKGSIELDRSHGTEFSITFPR